MLGLIFVICFMYGHENIRDMKHLPTDVPPTLKQGNKGDAGLLLS